jgi:hypothetical protein
VEINLPYFVCERVGSLIDCCMETVFFGLSSRFTKNLNENKVFASGIIAANALKSPWNVLKQY